MKGLLLFASFALIMMWCAYVTRKNRQFIDGKLEQNEANLQKLFKKIFIKSISTKIQSTVNKYYFVNGGRFVRLCYLYN